MKDASMKEKEGAINLSSNINNSKKATLQSHTHERGSRKKTRKSSRGRTKSKRRSLISEFYLKCGLTWEYADVFSNYWHESIKGEDTEKQHNISTLQTLKREEQDSATESVIDNNHLQHIQYNTHLGSDVFTVTPNKTTSGCSNLAAVSSHGCPENVGFVAAKSSATGNKEDFPAASNVSTINLEEFSEVRTLSNHQQIQTSEKLYKCSLCPKMFSLRGGLKRHLRIHSGEKPYKCTHCSKMFSQGGNLNRHLRVHSVSSHGCLENVGFVAAKTSATKNKEHFPAASNESNIISEEFSEISTISNAKRTQTLRLEAHLLRRSGEKPYKCTQCPEMFSQRVHLDKHLSNHSGEKPYKCALCSKTFSQGGSLTKHLLTHSDEKPYKCTLCPEMFSQRRGLNRHLKNHLGEKPYKCTECSAMFSKRWHLNRHLWLHSGEYKCEQCSQMFSWRGDLNRHLRVHYV